MDSGKTYILISGQVARVPNEHLKKIQKKEMLVARGSRLQDFLESDEVTAISYSVAHAELMEIIKQIISLNRRIPDCVEFV